MADSNTPQEEFLRLMRALYESVERESELQRQLRRTKETLVSVALRLQVAIKVAQEDETTMTSLIAQTEAARAKEIIATKKVEEATETINALSIEVNSLKRKLKALEQDRGQNNSSNTSNQQFQKINELADEEVEAMLERELRMEIPNFIDPVVANAATPFDRWKMSHFLYAPDTPAGSKAHDTHAVRMLLKATTAEVSPDKISRPTQASIIRSKKIFSGSSPSTSPLTSPLRPRSKHKDHFFLGDEAEQSWSHKSGFDRGNMGRINIWATRLADIPSTAQQRDSRSSLSRHRNMTSSGPVKLKSLKLSQSDKSVESPLRGKGAEGASLTKISI